MRDRRVLYTAAFLRSLGTGMVSVLIGIYLAKLGFDPVAIGTVVGAGLGGAAVAALVVTLAGDRIGRRKALYERFGAGEVAVGLLFFGARIANAGSHLGAAWLGKRIGLVNTVVFTHIPSSLLLVTVPFAPNFPVAAVLFLLREGLVEMDVPPRQSYVMAVVRAKYHLWSGAGLRARQRHRARGAQAATPPPREPTFPYASTPIVLAR